MGSEMCIRDSVDESSARPGLESFDQCESVCGNLLASAEDLFEKDDFLPASKKSISNCPERFHHRGVMKILTSNTYELFPA